MQNINSYSVPDAAQHQCIELRAEEMASTLVFCILFYPFTSHFSHLRATAPRQHYSSKMFGQLFQCKLLLCSLGSNSAILYGRISILVARLI